MSPRRHPDAAAPQKSTAALPAQPTSPTTSNATGGSISDDDDDDGNDANGSTDEDCVRESVMERVWRHEVLGEHYADDERKIDGVRRLIPRRLRGVNHGAWKLGGVGGFTHEVKDPASINPPELECYLKVNIVVWAPTMQHPTAVKQCPAKSPPLPRLTHYTPQPNAGRSCADVLVLLRGEGARRLAQVHRQRDGQVLVQGQERE